MLVEEVADRLGRLGLGDRRHPNLGLEPLAVWVLKLDEDRVRPGLLQAIPHWRSFRMVVLITRKFAS